MLLRRRPSFLTLWICRVRCNTKAKFPFFFSFWRRFSTMSSSNEATEEADVVPQLLHSVHTSTVRSKLSFIWLLLSPLHSLGKSPGNNQAMGSEKGNDSLLSFSVPFFFLLTSFFYQKEFCQSGHFHAGILRVCTTLQPRVVEQKKCQSPQKGRKSCSSCFWRLEEIVIAPLKDKYSAI